MSIETINILSEKINNEIKLNKNIKSCIKHLNNYNGNDWKKFIKFDEKYNRIVLFRNNDFEILLICWDKNQYTSIHKHPKNGCVFKTLEGRLFEKRYKTLPSETSDCKENKKIYQQTEYTKKNKSSYIDDNIGVHQINSKDIKSVSIHIYSPPLFYT